MSGSGLDRRRMLSLLGGAVAGPAVFSTGAHAEAGGDLVIQTNGGGLENAFRKFFYEPFTKETGIRIHSVVATRRELWPKLKAMHQIGRVEWDLINCWPEEMIINSAFLAPIDCGQFPGSVMTGLADNSCEFGGVLRTKGGVNLVYDTRKFPNGGPKTWAEFWDVKRFPGPRSLPDAGAPWWPIGSALQADGVKANELYPMDLDRAFRKLDEIRPHVSVWWRTTDQSRQMFRSGEVAAAMMYNGHAYYLKDEGIPLEVMWEGASESVGFWGRVKNSPNPATATRFMQYYLTRPEAHAGLAREIGYETPNLKALELMKANERERFLGFPANAKVVAQKDSTWLAKNYDTLFNRWSRWLRS